MGKLVDAEGMKSYLEGFIEWIEENKDEEYVFLVGDMVEDYNLSLQDGGDVKTIGPAGYVNEVFEKDGVGDLRYANLALYGTIAIPRSCLSEQGEKLVEGDIDSIKTEDGGS